MSMNYDVTAEREGKWWVFEIPALDTGGQARTLAEVDTEAHGIACAWLDVDDDAVTVTTTVRGVETELGEWHAAEDDDRAAREAAAAAAARRRAVVASLRGAGLTGADVARLVGVTKQRVSQLEKTV